jgi:hypothetical protein
MRLVSGPTVRALRGIDTENQNNVYITNIKNNLQISSIAYPQLRLGVLQKILFKVKKLLDLNVRIGYSRALLNKQNKKYYYLSKIIKIFSGKIDLFIIFFFRSKEYDEIVRNYDEVNIFTFCFITEIFLYSSAHRLGKRVIYTPDGWDVYSVFYIPTKCDVYEVWGLVDEKSLLLKVPNAHVKKIPPPFAQYKKNIIRKYITMYEGTLGEVPKIYQLKVIEQIIKFISGTQYVLIIKKLDSSISCFKNYELTEMGCEVFESTSNFSDLGKYFFIESNDLEKLIPKTALFVGFNSTHGYMEFGLNSIPSIGYITINNYQNSFIVRALKKAGVIFGLSYETEFDELFKEAFKANLNFNDFTNNNLRYKNGIY